MLFSVIQSKPICVLVLGIGAVTRLLTRLYSLADRMRCPETVDADETRITDYVAKTRDIGEPSKLPRVYQVVVLNYSCRTDL